MRFENLEESMPTARVRLKPTHDELAAFTTEYPTVDFKMLAVYPTEEGISVLLNAPIDETETLSQHLETTPEVLEFEILHSDAHGVLVQYVVPSPDPHRAALAARNLPNYPLIARDGWIYTEITTSQERLSKFKTELENAGVVHEILTVSESRDPTSVLTNRQTEFIIQALKEGYYDDPRKCTLTDFATEMGVDKSTASGILHRAEGRVLKEFFTEVNLADEE
jgi:predicted DNA binding protein